MCKDIGSMEERELKIGFYVQYGSEYCMIKQIDTILRIVVIESEFGVIYSTSIDSIKPIVITADLLIKLGFEKHKSNSYEYKELYRIEDHYFFDLKTYSFVLESEWEYDFLTLLTYVHEIQNLCQILISEELKFKKMIV